jgi:small-conductance mechanosensitive channel
MKILTILFIFINLLYAENKNNSVLITEEEKQQKLEEDKKQKDILKYNNLLNQLVVEENKFSNENIWIKKYSNYLVYKKIERDLKKIKHSKDKNLILTKNSELDLLKEYKISPFGNLINTPIIESHPNITNPIMVISAISHIKKLQEQNTNLYKKYKELNDITQSLKSQKDMLKDIVQLSNILNYKDNNTQKLKEVSSRLNDFSSTLTNFKTTVEIYNKKTDEVIINLTEQIKEQGVKAFYIGISITILLIFVFSIKYLLKKYITDNKTFYTANKALNIATFVIIFLIFLFAYLENVSYFVTFLGFASAGIAIAMKDWFMSVLGWVVMITGGSVHVGDRIKVKKDGQEFVGDVLDISMLRITLHEDITLTTYMENRRAGRIIFIPNNLIFTSIISNYSHSGLRTVWDGIDITITFDSNVPKAQHLVNEIVKKYSKGYTDITRKQLNTLRSKYNLTNTNVEPRVFSFIEPNGINISSWYQTNAFATLKLRSTISTEIVTAFSKEEDIKIAYPTQTINLKQKHQIEDFAL